MSFFDVRDDRVILTVGQINAYLKQMLDSDRILSNVYIKGEISNFTNHYKTGHLYFSLKDSENLIRAVMFRSSAIRLKFNPESGMKVIVHGRISLFPRDGQYQIYVDEMEPDGIGSLYLAFEQLKRKLEAEGLFSEERKRPIPKIPKVIGVITSPTGAAVRDIINITGRRFPMAKILLYPALVQGADAPASLIAGMNYFNREKNADVIILGRGGGSIEDLWAFNDEALARTVAASRIPVISAVGHETDFTICDFVADLRAPTPSAAAELAVPDAGELRSQFDHVIRHMNTSLSGKLNAYRRDVNRLAASRALTSPKNLIDDKKMLLASVSEEMYKTFCYRLKTDRGRFASLTASLDALNPMAVLTRGYAAVFAEDGKLVKSVHQIKEGDSFTFRTSDGQVKGKATEILENIHS